jgi:Ankyrin repeats (3 copies)
MENEKGFKIWESLILSPTTSVGEVREWIEKRGLDISICTEKYKNSLLTCFLHDSSSPDWKNICLLLIEKGVQIDHRNISQNTLLTLMCEYGSFEKVEFLVENKADINLANECRITPLMFACSNRMDYARIIPYLISKRASLEARDKLERRPLEWAFQCSSNIFDTIIPYYPINIRKMHHWYLSNLCADPYKCWINAIHYGCIDCTTKVNVGKSHTNTFKEEWLTFRCNELRATNQEDTTDVPVYSQKTKSWWECVLRNGGAFRRYSEVYGGTLLHIVCGGKDLEAVQMIIKRKAANPYLRNRAGQSAYNMIDIKNIEMQRLVHEYMMFKPTLQYADWLGPYFVEKARTLLLVNQRLGLFSRDVLIYILGWIACLDLY